MFGRFWSRGGGGGGGQLSFDVEEEEQLAQGWDGLICFIDLKKYKETFDYN